MKVKVYTVVPIDRIDNIKKYGLVPNNKLAELDIPDYLKVNNFKESEIGYIYNSTCIKNAIDWYKIIRYETNRACFLLKYEVDVALLENDKCSPHKIKTDTRIKDVVIKPQDIIIVKVDVYKDYYTDFSSKEEIPLMSVENPYTYLINDHCLNNDIAKEGIKNKNRNEKDIYYTVSLKEVFNKIEISKKLDYRFIATLFTAKDFNRVDFPSLFTTDIENAIGWKNTVEHMMNREAIILKCNIKNEMMKDNNTGISNTYCNAVATRPVRADDIISII